MNSSVKFFQLSNQSINQLEDRRGDRGLKVRKIEKFVKNGAKQERRQWKGAHAGE